MSDLEDLANAANYRRPVQRSNVRRGRGGRRFFFFAGLAVAAGIAGVAYYAGRSSGPPNIVDMMRQAIADRRAAASRALAPAASSLPDPKFRLSEQGHDSSPFVWSWIEVLNEDPQALTVNAIILNGEFPAQPGYWRFDRAELAPRNSEVYKPLPRTLAIGEDLFAMESRPNNYAGCYYKQVIFVDIYTNRGNFRYRSGRITGEAPPLDAPKMAAIEETIRIDTEKRDAEEAAAAERVHQLPQVRPPAPGGGGVMGPTVIPGGGGNIAN